MNASAGSNLAIIVQRGKLPQFIDGQPQCDQTPEEYVADPGNVADRANHLIEEFLHCHSGV